MDDVNRLNFGTQVMNHVKTATNTVDLHTKTSHRSQTHVSQSGLKIRMNLKELSQKLGLSQTTVSRALNGYPEVKEATRKKVLEAAKTYGYSPNFRAKGLATGQSHAIGHVIPTANRHEMVNPIFGDFIAGAAEVYLANNYEMVLSITDDDNELDVYRKLKTRGTVDGVILHGPKMQDERIGLMQELGLPFVVHGRACEVESTYSWLDVNNRSAFRRATEFLLDLGHSRIVLLNGIETMGFANRRRMGYEQALNARGIDLDPALMRSSEMTERYGYVSTREFLTDPNPPTAFLVSSIITALGVRRAIEECGLKMGRDISVITHDDCLSYLENGDDIPIFTATRSSVRTAGPQQKLLEAELTVGQSTGPAPAARTP